jgi:hypothetical protein
MCPPGNVCARADGRRDLWDDIGVDREVLTLECAPRGTALPAAVLTHSGAPGGDHFDVLLAVRVPASEDDRACATWRADADPGCVAPGGSIRVKAIHPHRAAYLTLRGVRELDAGRGTVAPVRRGRWRMADDGAIELTWDGGGTTVVRPEAADRWRILG